ncbi:MAG: polyphosphate polymerase domain-containing protein [Bacteriovoracaceae bacterium]
MPMLLPKNSNYRYERKFLIEDSSRAEIEQAILFHPKHFKRIHEPRYINNIYFDTPDWDACNDNLIGFENRFKYRIRWYGDLEQTVSPNLEVKIKSGIVGTKLSQKLKTLNTESKALSGFDFVSYLRNSEVPQDILMEVTAQKPVLVNRYLRSYFLSIDGKVRVTVDSGITFKKITAFNSSNFFVPASKRQVLIEMKYDRSEALNASEITRQFSFLLTKNSKYVTGVEALYS